MEIKRTMLDSPDPWWVGPVWTCENCNAQFTMKHEDAPMVETLTISPFATKMTHCPCCGKWAYLRQDDVEAQKEVKA